MTLPTYSDRRLVSRLVLAAVVIAAVSTVSSRAQTKKAEGKKAEPVAKESRIVDVVADGVGGQAQILFINDMLDKGWKDNKLVHADRCSDYEFIRRASLDIIGRIATLKEIEKFFSEPVERRRSRLIERLLASTEYTYNWANIWTVLLTTRTGTPTRFQDEMRRWLSEKFAENDKLADWSEIVTELVSAEGETDKNGAVNFVLAHLGEPIKQDIPANGKYDMVPVTSRTTRLFLGLRTQCVQCHDHPFNDEWKQSHFWGINAFFRQADPSGRPSMMMPKLKKGEKPKFPEFNLRDNPAFNTKGLVPYERRSGVLLYTDATFLDGKKMLVMKDSSKLTRRAALARFITTSPYFAKAYVNRTWGHFFGRGFTKDAVDDFGEHNPVSHPELLEKLSEEWAKNYNYHPKALIRWICNSKAYGLSSSANSSNDKPEDEAFFARMLLKALTPEQLFDSLMTATGAKAGQTEESKAKLRQGWLQKLIVNFGDDEGNEGSFNGTVIQALMLMNGEDINNAITDKDTGTASLVMRQYPPSTAAMAAKAMDILFKAALNRPPTTKELNKILDPKTFSFTNRPGAPASRDPVSFWTAYYQDIFWALLNSNEFILNH